MGSYTTHITLLERLSGEGSASAWREFCDRYGPVIRAYLSARWQHTPLFDEVDDAAQQVFVDCFKHDGALGRADPARSSGFRAFLFGVVRNVARAIERKRARSRESQATSSVDLQAIASKEESCATAFDRSWATGLLRDAAELQLARARQDGADAVRRHGLLGLRYGENLPIREIAARWKMDRAVLHREFGRDDEEHGAQSPHHPAG